MALDYKSGLSRYRRYLQVLREQPLIRAGIWTALSLVLVIAMIVLALKPTLVVIAGLFGQIRQNREIITKLDDKIVKLQQASANLNQVSQRLPILDEAIPMEPEWNIWSNQLMEIASQSGVQLLTVDVGPVSILEKKDTGKNDVPAALLLPPEIDGLAFSVSATGSYDNLRQMVTAMENTGRLCVLSDVKFTSAKAKNENNELSVYIKGIAVYKKL